MKVSTSIIRLAIPASIVAVMCLSVAAAADDRYDVARRTSQAAQALQEKGQWDMDELKLEIQELMVLGEDLLVTGFDAAEIDIIVGDDADGLDAGLADALPTESAVTVSRAGDLWRLDQHLLCQGDAGDPASYAALFADGALARMVLTDEPYNVPNLGHVTRNEKHREFAMAHGEMSSEQFLTFNLSWMKQALACVLDGGLLATFIDWRSLNIVLQSADELQLALLNLIVWNKTNGGMGSLWRSQHELLPVFKKGNAAHINNVALGRFGRWRSNVWTYPGASSLGSDARSGLADHPTVKPVALLEDALLDVTDRGDVVLDPFAGSGSTLVAAERTGRRCRAIEIDGPYCDLIIRRWQGLTGKLATLAATGDSFDTVATQQHRPAIVERITVEHPGGLEERPRVSRCGRTAASLGGWERDEQAHGQGRETSEDEARHGSSLASPGIWLEDASSSTLCRR